MGKKGTSLPDNWKLPDEWRAYALGIGFSDEKIDDEASKFKMYWLSRADNATKLDWKRTWENWCIRILHFGAWK